MLTTKAKTVPLLVAASTFLTLGVPASSAATHNLVAGLIVPGKMIGRLRLGSNANTATAQYGRDHSQDAAMGHYVESWKSRDGSLIAVASEIDSHGGLTSPIREIAVSSSFFKTAQGIGPGSSLTVIERAYPAARAVRHSLKTAYVGKVALLDDKAQGIAFQFAVAGGKLPQNAGCSAVIIHDKGLGVLNLYLPLYSVDQSGAITSAT